MSDLKTVFTDDDGDGIFDDVHVVTTMEDHSLPTHRPTYYHHAPQSTSSSGGQSFFSVEEKLKIAGIVAAVLFGSSILTSLGGFIIALIHGIVT